MLPDDDFLPVYDIQPFGEAAHLFVSVDGHLSYHASIRSVDGNGQHLSFRTLQTDATLSAVCFDGSCALTYGSDGGGAVAQIIQPEVVGLIPSVVTFDAEGEHAVRHVDAVYDGFPQVTSAETVVGHRGHGLVGKERDALSFVSGYPCLHAVESVFQSRGFLAQRDAACPATGIRVEHVTAIGIHHVVV